MTAPLVEFAGLPDHHQPRMPAYGAPPAPRREPLWLGDIDEAARQPATQAQAAEIIRLLRELNAMLARTFGPGR